VAIDRVLPWPRLLVFIIEPYQTCEENSSTSHKICNLALLKQKASRF
jgi:hypothetical protein